MLIWLSIGSGVGWLTSVTTRADTQNVILFNIIAGAVGAYAGGALVAPALTARPPLNYLIALALAALMLAMVRVAQARMPR